MHDDGFKQQAENWWWSVGNQFGFRITIRLVRNPNDDLRDNTHELRDAS
jgi:hypothetical protein